MAYNSDRFSLANWKITLPVDSGGGTGGTAIEIKNLTNYESAYFYDAPDGAMVFRADVSGATTGGSKYARSELREMKGSERAAWKLSEGGTMTATLKIDKAPVLNNGLPGKIVIGQIHGQDEELIRLYWENGKIYFRNDLAGPDNKELTFTFKNGSGHEPNVSIGEKFSYKIDARGDALKVDIFADEHVYSSVTKINSVWQSDEFYFKAGVYLGVNETQGSGGGQVSFYGLDFGHTPGSGLQGLPGTFPPSPPPPPTDENPDPAVAFYKTTSKTDNIAGTAGNDEIAAWYSSYTGADSINAGAGKDTIKFLSSSYGFDFTKVGPVKGVDVIDVTSAESIRKFVLSSGLVRESDGGQVHVLYGDAGIGGLDTSKISASGRVILSGGKATVSFADSPFNHALIENASGLTIKGGAGAETIGILDGSANVKLYGGGGNDALTGGKSADYVSGGDGNDRLYGDAGNDSLYGNAGNDALHGGDGKDSMSGGSGNDIIEGGKGADTLRGDSGADVFLYADILDGGDVIKDFHASEGDRIDIADLLAANGLGSAAATSGGYVRVESSGSSALLRFDADGAAGALSAVTLATIEDASPLDLALKIIAV